MKTNKNPTYRCAHCKSTKVQGTLTAWFRVNEDGLEAVEVDSDADWGYGYCEECEESGDFLAVAERVDKLEA